MEGYGVIIAADEGSGMLCTQDSGAEDYHSAMFRFGLLKSAKSV
jgi:hypothetical protein